MFRQSVREGGKVRSPTHRPPLSPEGVPVRLRLKCDGTRAETRFRLSAKRTSPFTSAGASVRRLLAAEVCGSTVVMLDTPCSEVVREYWLLTPFASFPFTSPPVRHGVPTGFNRTLLISVRG
jgi:hypothetical protein